MQDGRDYSCKHKWRKVSFWDEADFSGEAWDNFMIDDNICPDRATVPEMKIMISSLYHNQDVVKKLEPGWRVEEYKEGYDGDELDYDPFKNRDKKNV
jgi:hypothetical protein